MANTYKVLAQSNPAATTNTALYTCASASGAVVSTISVCNQAGVSATYRIAVRPLGATLAAQHYIAYDAPITANNSTMLTIGISVANTDVITVYASSATLSFSAFGTEIS